MAILLAIELLLLWQIFRGIPQARTLSIYESLVVAFVSLSALHCLLAEALGLVGCFTPSVLAVLHTIITCGLGVCCFLMLRRGARGIGWSKGQVGVFALAVALTVLPALSAIFAPPSNWDSMTYHLPRITHWLSQGSLDHYQTYIARQLYLNPGHEIILAHGVGLGGSDRYAGLLNSVALFVAMVASAGIALRVGGGLFAQLAAVVVMGTIPMGILQASTTQNDLLHGLFLTAALLGMIIVRQGLGPFADTLMWLSIGLALLTKGLSFIWVPAIALVAFPWRNCLSSRGIKRVALGMLVVLLLNSGFWLRNVVSFGHPLAPVGEGPIKFAQYPVEKVSFATLVSSLARNIFLHSNTPITDLGPHLHPGLEWLHAQLELDPSDSSTTLGGTHFGMAEPTRIHEDLAGNGSTLALGFFSCFLLCGMARIRRRTVLSSGLPVLAALFGAVLMCAVLRWQPWGSRLQLPLFMVAAPGIAALLSSVLSPLCSIPLFLLLLWVAGPYWINNELRPLIGSNSIVTGDDDVERYRAQIHLHDEFTHVEKQLRAIGCRRVGIVLSEDDWEHGLFASLGMNVKVRSCKVPAQHGRYLWLAHRRFRQPTPCALVWFGGDVPEKVGACGRGFRRVEEPRLINVLLPRAQDVEGSVGPRER